MPTEVSPGRTWVLPEEPLPVRLINTIWADAGGIHDDLRVPADLDQWMDSTGLDRAGTRATAEDLTQALGLRDALRRLVAYRTQDTRPAAPSPLASVQESLDLLNAAATAVPTPHLALEAGRLVAGIARTYPPVVMALARVAGEAVNILGEPKPGRLRACWAPGCVLFFLAAHPRRAWCSVACGNRVRAARHYARIRRY